MYKLHEKFKTELKPNKKIIDKKFVIDYVNSLHPAQQMFIINYKSNRDNLENKNQGNTIYEYDEYDNSITSMNTCPTSIIAEPSTDMMIDI